MSESLDLSRKIIARADIAAVCGRPRDYRLVFTNGVFDVLHRGHVEYLNTARSLGDRLIVALNSDASARRLGKGPERPVNNEQDRAHVIAALASVDYVTFFEEDTPRELIAGLLPDVLVKGGDYRPDTIVGREDVEAAGGRVEVIPFLPGRSTTSILRKLQEDA